MSRIKDKLYYLLVEKNPSIRDEYQGYVNSHQEEHVTDRAKHWRLLIKLNWHYRILRKKTLLLPVSNQSEKKVRLPYLDGSESEAFERQAAIHFAKNLLEYDIISFDIFDTLILRPFAQPTDLFMIIGSRLGIMNFKKIRIDAERDARAEMTSNKGHHEVTIYDIYKKVSRRTGIDINKGVETELETEKDYCFANPYMKHVFKILLDQGKDIIITSDMYIPHDRMEELLASCGYTGYKKLYVSCDYSCSKRSGGLYKNLIYENDGKKIIHVGDNFIPDIESAKKAGIATKYYKNCHEIGNPYRSDGMSELIGSFYAGIVNTHLHNGTKTYNPYYEYGFIYGGLYIVGYCNWIYRKAKTEGVEKILFLARDGDIYQKVFNMMFDDMPNEYVYWSRIANLKYATENNRDDFLTRLCSTKANNAIPCTIGDVLIGFGLDILIPKLGNYNLKKDAVLTPELVKTFEDFLIEHWDMIIETYNRETQLAQKLFKKVIGKCKKVAVVDVGWMGSGPLGIKYLVEDKWQMDCKVKCYIAASSHSVVTYNVNELMKNETETYIFSRMYNRNLYDVHLKTNKNINTIFFEMFTQACYPSFSGLGNDLSYKFDIPEVENYKITYEIHKGIIDFGKQYIEFCKKDSYLLNITGYDAYLPYRFITRDLRLIKKIFMKVAYSRQTGINIKKQKQEHIFDILAKVKL